MLSNYLKLAWRILARRKFFTLISLFGISFTLGLLMVTLSFLQTELGANEPLSNKNDFVYVEQIRLERTYYDTITVVDTSFQNGVAVYDTTFNYKESGTGASQTEMSNKIVDNYLRGLPSAADMTMFSTSNTHDVFVNGVKLTLDILLADARYWSIFDHKPLEGRFFDSAEVEAAAQVIVISTKTAQDYFGRESNVVDEEMFIDGKTYKVIGVYKNNGKIIEYVSPAAVTPYTTMNMATLDNFYFGPFEVMYLKQTHDDAEKLKDEIRLAGTKVPVDHPDNEHDFKDVVLQPMTYNEMYAQGVYYEEDAEDSYAVMKWILLGLLTFFTVLPTLNLINLNVSRIMDRSSEIGVRKAFGAHQGNIIAQFIVENIVQTILGGIIGLGIAILLINIINKGGYLGTSELTFNTKFFIYSFLATLVFGVLSGFLPAYKMSKLQIVKALKENQL